MKTITANGVELLLVEVPEDAKDFYVLTPNYGTDLGVKSDRYDLYANGIFNTPIQFLGLKEKPDFLGTITNGVVDFDVEGLVKEIHPEGVYEDYTQNEEGFYDAKKSFLSLLAANGITGKKIVCLKISKA